MGCIHADTSVLPCQLGLTIGAVAAQTEALARSACSGISELLCQTDLTSGEAAPSSLLGLHTHAVESEIPVLLCHPGLTTGKAAALSTAEALHSVCMQK